MEARNLRESAKNAVKIVKARLTKNVKDRERKRAKFTTEPE